MTREEAIEVLQASSIKQLSHTKIIVDGKFLSVKVAFDMAIKALEQDSFDIETYCKEHFCVMVDKDVWEKAEKALKQEPKTGHWKIIPSNHNGEYRPRKYACSECGWTIDLCRGLQQDTGHRLFCEHCGARMEGET